MYKNKNSFSVIFDTSSLLEGKPVRKTVVEFMDKCSQDGRLTISFHVPEVVREEVKKNVLFRIRKAKAAYEKSLADLSSLAGVEEKLVVIEEEEQLQKVEAQLSKIGFKTISTPIDKIDLLALLKKAVFYLPPFQEGKEKGFKDSIIAETIQNAAQELSKKGKVIIIVGDDLLRKFLIDSKSEKDYEVFESVPDFESALELQLLQIDEKFIEQITKMAEVAFSDATNSTGLFWKENLKAKIYSKYHNLFENPQIESGWGGFSIGDEIGSKPIQPLVLGSIPIETWIPQGGGRYEMAKPVFIKREGDNIFFWKSTVLFRRSYVKYPPSGMNGSVNYVLEFVVDWQTTIQADGKIVESRLVEIAHANTETQTGYSNAGWWSEPYKSNATVSGQGTVPVVWNDGSGDNENM